MGNAVATKLLCALMALSIPFFIERGSMITFITDEYIIDPLGIAYLSAMLKENGYHAKLLLTSELNNTVIDTPIVAYSVTTGKHRHYVEINRQIKERYPNIISIFGGPHCTFFPDFAKEYGVDFIFRGEGFEAIVQFLDRYVKDKGMNTETIYKTPNVAYFSYDDGNLRINHLLPAMKVAELPFPDRKLIYQFKRNQKNPIRNVMASFGCPMQCTYCYNKQFKKLGYIVRIRPVENVIEECERLVKEYPTQLIYFQDDIFPVYGEDWLQSFCEEYGKRVKTPFHIQMRIEMLNSDCIQHLKSAGLHGVTFAVETADEDARLNLLGRSFRPCRGDAILDGAKLLKQHGVKFRIENMLGIPGETFQSALRTLDLNIKCHPSVGWASLFAPYPGTDLGDYCQQQNLIDGDFDADFFTHATLKLKDKKQIERLQKLFGLICAIPQLRPLVPLLTSLPFTYQAVYKQVKRFLYDRRLYRLDMVSSKLPGGF